MIVTSVTLTLYTPSVIPASGGTVSSTSYAVTANGYIRHDWASGTYSTGSTTSWTVTDSATISWGSAVSAGSKGTTTGGTTTAGTLSCTATYSGKSNTKSVYVTQQANSRGSAQYTSVTISSDVDSAGVIPASGGSVNSMPSSDITSTAYGYYKYTSNATSSTSTSCSPTFSYTGVTASSRGTTTGGTRTAGTLYVQGVWNSITSNKIGVTVHQAANRLERTTWTSLTYDMGSHPTIPASGGTTQKVSITDGMLQGYGTYTSNATGASGQEVTIPANNISWTGVGETVASRGTTTGAVQTVKTIYSQATYCGQTSSQYSVRVTQEANRRSTTPTWVDLSVTITQVADIPASGGTVSTGKFSCQRNGYYTYTSNATSSTATTVSSGSTTYSFTSVHAPSLEDEVTGRASVGTITVSVTYSSLSGSGSATVYQQANAVVGSATTTSQEHRYTSSSQTTGDYSVSASPTRISLSSSGSSSVTVTVTASHKLITTYNYDVYQRTGVTKWYTSTFTGDPVYNQWRKIGTTTDTDEVDITDTPSVRVSDSNWLTATTSQIKIAAQSPGNGARTGYTYYSNSTASTTVTITQVKGSNVYWVAIDGVTGASVTRYLDLAGQANFTITCGGGSTSFKVTPDVAKKIWYKASTTTIWSNSGSTATSRSYSSGTRLDVLCNMTKDGDSSTLTLSCGSGASTGYAYITIEPTGD